jgi:histone H3/H4
MFALAEAIKYKITKVGNYTHECRKSRLRKKIEVEDIKLHCHLFMPV